MNERKRFVRPAQDPKKSLVDIQEERNGNIYAKHEVPKRFSVAQEVSKPQTKTPNGRTKKVAPKQVPTEKNSAGDQSIKAKGAVNQMVDFTYFMPAHVWASITALCTEIGINEDHVLAAIRKETRKRLKTYTAADIHALKDSFGTAYDNIDTDGAGSIRIRMSDHVLPDEDVTLLVKLRVIKNDPLGILPARRLMAALALLELDSDFVNVRKNVLT